MDEQRTMYKREAVRICEDRGWSAEQIAQFLGSCGDIPFGYTVGMIDAFEFSVNGPVIEELHPSAARNL